MFFHGLLPVVGILHPAVLMCNFGCIGCKDRRSQLYWLRHPLDECLDETIFVDVERTRESSVQVKDNKVHLPRYFAPSRNFEASAHSVITVK
jgi:hypothetical protein